MKKKCDLSDFECGVEVGAIQAGLNISHIWFREKKYVPFLKNEIIIIIISRKRVSPKRKPFLSKRKPFRTNDLFYFCCRQADAKQSVS